MPGPTQPLGSTVAGVSGSSGFSKEQGAEDEAHLLLPPPRAPSSLLQRLEDPQRGTRRRTGG